MLNGEMLVQTPPPPPPASLNVAPRTLFQSDGVLTLRRICAVWLHEHNFGQSSRHQIRQGLGRGKLIKHLVLGCDPRRALSPRPTCRTPTGLADLFYQTKCAPEGVSSQ